MEAKYKRVLLKISGEALAGDKKVGINEEETGSIMLPVSTISMNQ